MKTEDLIQEIERNRRLSELESTSRKAHDNYNGMPEKEAISCYIEHLISQFEAKDLQIRSLEIKIEELTARIAELLEEKRKDGALLADVLSELKALRSELVKYRSEAIAYRKKIAKLEEQLKAAKAEKYGRRRSKSKDDDNEGGMSAPDRSESEDTFDGSVDQSVEHPVSDSKECRNSSATGQTFNASNSPETYRSMGMNGSKVVHKSDRSRVPEGTRVIETKNVVLYSQEMSLVAHEYELLHVVESGKKPVWKYYPSAGHPDRIMRFDGTKATPEFMQALPTRCI